MPFIIKMRKVRAYVSNIYKKSDKYFISYHKHINKSKVWKTEKGVKTALIKYINNSNKNLKDFMVIEKTNSELGIFDSGKLTIVYKNKPRVIKKKKKLTIKLIIFKIKSFKIKKIDLKDFIKSNFKYITEWFKNNTLIK